MCKVFSMSSMEELTIFLSNLKCKREDDNPHCPSLQFRDDQPLAGQGLDIISEHCYRNGAINLNHAIEHSIHGAIHGNC